MAWLPMPPAAPVMNTWRPSRARNEDVPDMMWAVKWSFTPCKLEQWVRYQYYGYIGTDLVRSIASLGIVAVEMDQRLTRF